MPYLTTLDIAKIDAGADYPLIEEAFTLAPELGLIPADTILGTSVTLTVRTGLPTVGFRGMNAGVDPGKSTYETKVFQTYNLDALMQVDEKLVTGTKNPARVLDNEAVGTMTAGVNTIGSQLYYGDVSGVGFPGLIAQAANDAAHVIDKTGASARSSVWLVELGREKLEFIWGNNQVVKLEPWEKATLTDAAGKKYPGMEAWMKGSIGLRLANKNAAYRLKNVGTAAGKTLVDADLFVLRALAAKAGANLRNCVFLMSPRSLEQLRASRTATNPTGAPAPIPTDLAGIRIVETGSISEDEQA